MPSLEERFWSRIDKNGPTQPHTPHLGPCWIWTAGCFKHGYGAIWHAGKQRKASRVSWELHHGEIPAGLNVLHACDHPPCCNPAHLFLGTLAQNNADAVAKGRGCVRYPDEAIRGVFEDRARGLLQTEIAERRGITQSYVSMLLSGRARRSKLRVRAEAHRAA